jgi:IS4 transposase
MARKTRARQERAQKTRAQKKRTQQRRHKKRNPATNNECFKKLREWFLADDGIFSQINFHGNIKWTPVFLVWLAVCWAWADARNLTDAFTEALGCCEKMFGPAPIRTYQGFMKALVGWTPKLMPILRMILRRCMKQVGGRFWRIGGWVLIGFDGSRNSAPRSESNEEALCAPNYGKGHTSKHRKKKTKGMRRKRNKKNPPQPQEPQAWVTMMWHMGERIPWDWRLGPSNSSERAHVMEMLQAQKFPKKTLFCGDAGFVGYPIWSCILLQKKRDFLIRVGANVSLLREQAEFRIEKDNKKEGMLVLCWPKTAIEANQPPLRLRLVKVCLGKTHAWMLTSVLDPKKLSAKAMVRFYKMRWGIEVEFRGLKQTLDRAKLRSRTHENIMVELDWSILAMAIAELFALKEQLAESAAKSAKKPARADPAKRSLANTMRALRWCMRNLDEAPEPGQDLTSRLRDAVTDSYVRKKPKRARYRPKNPDKKPLGDPKIRPLSKEDKRKLDQIPKVLAA